MTRKIGNETIKIQFDCQAEEEIDDTNYDQMNSEEDTEEHVDEEPEMNVGIRFETTITQESGDKMIINAIAGGEIAVQSVTMIPKGSPVKDEDYYGGQYACLFSQSGFIKG